MKKLLYSISNIILFFLFLFLFFTDTLLINWHDNTLSLFFISFYIFLMFLVNLLIFSLRGVNYLQQLVFWSTIYVICVFIFSFLIKSTKFSITDLLLNVLLYSLSQIIFYYLQKNLNEYNHALERIFINFDQKGINQQQATELIDTELYRSRRFDHSFNIHIIQFDIDEVIHENKILTAMLKTVETRFLSSQALNQLKQNLRRTDLPSSFFESNENNIFYLVIPESPKESVEIIEQKIKLVAKEMNLSVSIGSASFPADAISSGRMIEIAQQRKNNQNSSEGKND